MTVMGGAFFVKSKTTSVRAVSTPSAFDIAIDLKLAILEAFTLEATLNFVVNSNPEFSLTESPDLLE